MTDPAADDPRQSQIAVIGMAGRFPGAPTVERFWQNLAAGRETIATFSRSEMLAAGVPAADLADASHIGAGGALDDVEMFDPGFFGFTQREAEVTDPQHRLFLECAWEALEDAGHAPGCLPGPVGVFAGSSLSTYLVRLLAEPGLARGLGRFRTLLGNDKDFLSTWVSYKLELEGPSIAVQTACSTSLVAVHLACQSLLNLECDLALAGGVTVSASQRWGYRFQEGGIHSPDGHCRAFDAGAQGTVPGNGVGVVTLRRLVDAIADGDPVRAVILGSAINNDGSRKLGFTAPSVEGQARVIAEALAIAGVDAASLDYVEAHGTGTQLGDPIEVEALARAFQGARAGAGAWRIGSVKSNVGHLDAAAGVAGLIKTVLALERGWLPASLHYESPNPAIDFARAGIEVNSQLQRWPRGKRPRRAGVSSFGIGGTNAHVVLEEAPEVPEATESAADGPAREVLVLSARSAAAVARAGADLAAHLREQPRLALRDVAFTLQQGRKPFGHRRAVVCGGHEEAIAALAGGAILAGPPSGVSGEEGAVFMFPGQGLQVGGAAADLYRRYPAFRDEIDGCASLLAGDLELDLRSLLFPEPAEAALAERLLSSTAALQPALFSLEYALARLWMSCGVEPRAMIGHSLGEYVAACLAGVFSLADALALVAERGRLIARQPAGGLLAVALDEPAVRGLLDGGLALAAVNGPARCVVAGSREELAELAARLQRDAVPARPLPAAHAFHSSLLDAARGPLVARVAQVPLAPPRLAYLSNVTGTWITAAEATSPEYWGAHLRDTVRFGDGLARLAERPGSVLLEVGPGETLTALARGARGLGLTAVPSLPPPRGAGGAAGEHRDGSLLAAAARIWCAGVSLDWRRLCGDRPCRRVPLPTYPFERRRCWLDTPLEPAAAPPETARREPSMTERPVASSAARRAAIDELLRAIVHGLVGSEGAAIDVQRPFLELGVDSLLLIQFGQEVKRRTGVVISLGDLLESMGTLAAVAARLDAELPADYGLPAIPPAGAVEAPIPVAAVQAPIPPVAAVQAPIPPVAAVQAPIPPVAAAHASVPAAPGAAAPGAATMAIAAAAAGAPAGLRDLLERQLQAMSGLLAQQLDLLRQAPGAGIAASSSPSPAAAPQPSAPATAAPPIAPPAPPPAAAGEGARREVFVPYQPLEPGPSTALTPVQQRHLEALIRHADRRTGESKRRTQRYRRPLADNRNSVGFRSLWKELTYPILAQRSAGSRVWDVDGNEYLDIAMGFGVYLFGHSPDFVMAALRDQLQRGIQIGPQSDLAGEVAERLCALTGLERAAFANSGTEAVMFAVRLARAVTGRSRIALFTGSYHGTADCILARGVPAGGQLRTAPMAPGITPGAVEDVVMLDYDAPGALDTVRALGGELAAVLVEPVQGRRPDYQPRELLQELRRITAAAGTALIFDEVVTGFRCHPGGAQAWFDVRADLVTYGKVLGGGMPIGVVGGKDAYLDAIDGGDWRFGDASYPRADKTMFAGTFCKHPLAMAAARAVLAHLEREGPGLQQRLNARTAEFAGRLDADLAAAGLPLSIRHFGSQFRLAPASGESFQGLLPHHLIKHGVYVWEGNTCFLSTAHSDDDLARIHDAVLASCEEMRQGGFFSASSPSSRRPAGLAAAAPPAPGGGAAREIPLTAGQREIWVLSRLGPEVSRAYNEAVLLELRGDFDPAAMRRALALLVDRHQVLRATVTPDGKALRVVAHGAAELPLADFTGAGGAGGAGGTAADPALAAWLREEAGRPFDLERGPLLRTRAARLGDGTHWLLIVIHHLAVDGVSYGVLLGDLGRLYLAERGGPAADLPRATQFEDYVRAEAGAGESLREADERYWLDRYADGMPRLELPASHPRPARPTFGVERFTMDFAGELCRALQELSARGGATLFSTLLAAFHLLLHELTGQEDLVVGIAAAGQVAQGQRDLVGYCVNPLCLRTRIAAGGPFAAVLEAVKRSVLEGFAHQSYPLGRLFHELGLRRAAGQPPLVPVVFNLDRAGTPRFADLDVEMSTVPTGAKCEVYWSLIESGGRLRLECDYSVDRFTRATIEDWALRFDRLLRRITAGEPAAAEARREPAAAPAAVAAAPAAPAVAAAPATQTAADWLELTDGQRHFWVGQELHPELPLFNEVVTFRLPVLPGFDSALLLRAAREVMAGSDVLRTVFQVVDGSPRQGLLPELAHAVEWVDFSAAPDGEGRAAAWIEARRRERLDPSRCLVDAALLATAAGACLWYQNIHHILVDGLSHVLLFEAIAERYAQLAAGTPGSAAALPAFRPFVERELATRGGAERTAAEAWWRQELARPTPPLRLYGRPRHPQALAARRVRVDLGAARSRRIRELALALQPGPGSDDRKLFQFFGTVLAVYLWRVSGERSLAIGAPFHNRLTGAAQRTPGLFMIILPVRLELAAADTFAAALERFAGQWREAMRHRAHAPENRLLEPVYEVVLNLHKMRAPRFQGLPTEMRWIHADYLLESLALQVWDLEDRFELEFDVRLELFPEATCDRQLGHFTQLIDAVLAAAAAPIGDLSLLGDAERAAIVSGRRQRRDFPLERPFVELFAAQAQRTPDAPALASRLRTLSYRELDELTNRLAWQLAAAGAGPETLVAILAERSADLWVAVLAALKAGAAFLPLDPTHPAARLRQVLDRSSCSLVVVSAALGGTLELAAQGFTGPAAPRVLALEALLGAAGPDAAVPLPSQPQRLAYVLFTSGSTGVPKGVMVDQRAMINHLCCKLDSFAIIAADTMAQTASQCFDISIWQFLAPLLVGGRVLVVPDDEVQDPARLLRVLARERVTLVEVVPSMLGAIVEAARASSSPPDLTALRWLIASGEALPPAHCRAWSSLYPGIPVANVYGATETADDVTHHLLAAPPAADASLVPVGRPLPNVDVYVLQGIEAQPDGVVGEVCAGGLGVGRGYLADPARTAVAFCPDPFSETPGGRLYRLGDLGRFGEDGTLELFGRLDHQVKVHGVRIELQEVESALAAHPALREVAVLARDEGREETFLVAYCVPRQDAAAAAAPAPTTTELRRFLRHTLPEAMIPAAFVMLQALPLGSTGKVDRAALPALGGERPELEGGFVAPRTETEHALAEIWKAVLGIERVGVNDSFFELGGDSILSLLVASRAARAGIRFEPIEIFSRPTIAELASLVAAAGVAAADAGEVAAPASAAAAPAVSPALPPAAAVSVPLTPIQEWFFELALANPHHFNQAVLLGVSEPVELGPLRAAWQIVAGRHDALALRFERTAAGWRQFRPAQAADTFDLQVHDLSTLSRDHQTAAVEAAASALQASLDLASGPLARFAVFDLGPARATRLLWVIHHLAVDGVSWRILLEELHTAYDQLRRGSEVELPPASTPFAEWARRLGEAAGAAGLRAELGYWLHPRRLEVVPLPVDLPAGENTVASARHLAVSLTAAETRALLQDVPTAWKTQINGALLAALGTAVAGWSGSRVVLVDLEGHGREAVGEAVDVSRTVGWFTSLFPVLLELGPDGERVELALRRVHDQLAEVPGHGIGYGLLRFGHGDRGVRERLAAMPSAEIAFNYLGQLDSTLPRTSSWGTVAESAGRDRAPGGRRRHRFEINALVSGGELRVNWTYSAGLHRPETVEALAQAMLAALRAIVARAQDAIAGEFAAADFADFDWSQKEVNEISAALGVARAGTRAGGEAEP